MAATRCGSHVRDVAQEEYYSGQAQIKSTFNHHRFYHRYYWCCHLLGFAGDGFKGSRNQPVRCSNRG